MTPWTVAHQAPLSMAILQARILEWVAIPSSGDLPDPGIELGSPALQAYSLPVQIIKQGDNKLLLYFITQA